MGMQLFAKNYFDQVLKVPGGEMPRWNFNDFGHSFMIIFRVLCGEWIDSMWDCMLVTRMACVPFFLVTVVFGNLVVLNLFLVLFLSSFGASNLSGPTADAETNRIAEAFNRIGRFKQWVKGGIRHFFMVYLASLFSSAKNKILPTPPPSLEEPSPPVERVKPRRPPRLAEAAKLVINSNKLMNNLKCLQTRLGTMASYGSHNYFVADVPTKKKPKIRPIPVDKNFDHHNQTLSSSPDDSSDDDKEDLEWCDEYIMHERLNRSLWRWRRW